MDSFQAYKFYIATKLHFTTDGYNVFKTNGAVKATRDSFYKRNDNLLFDKLARKFVEPRELIQYFVANFAYGNENLVYTPEESDYNYKQWMKVKQSLSKFFEDDLDKIISRCETESKLELYTSGNDPILFKMFIAKEISIETVCILNSFVNFIPKWKSSHMNFMWESDIRRIEKCSGFVKPDKARIDKIYENYLGVLNTL